MNEEHTVIGTLNYNIEQHNILVDEINQLEKQIKILRFITMFNLGLTTSLLFRVIVG